MPEQVIQGKTGQRFFFRGLHKLLTTHQAGKFLGVSRRYLWRLLISSHCAMPGGRHRGAGWRTSKMGSLSETGGKR
jgi:hypothetical protein